MYRKDVVENRRQQRAANGCRFHPDEIEVGETYRTRKWEASCTGAPVRIDLHDGGHGLPQGWTARARMFLESRLAEQSDR